MELTLNPTIMIRYKAKSSRNALRVLLALSPFWGLWAVWMAVWAAKSLPAITDMAVMNVMVCLMLFLPVLTLLSLFSVFVCLQNNFQISAKGIQFPLWCLFELKFRPFRDWKDVAGIEFVESSAGAWIPSESPEAINLKFKDGSHLPLSLTSFEKDDLQSFILALQSYVPDLPVEPALKDLRIGVSTDSRTQQALSFTQIWEDDMSSRFGSTAFVPLEAGVKLQNDKIEIIGQIAFGGLSAIYLGKTAAGVCVVKEAVVPNSSDLASKEKAMELFSREAKILMSLKHPKIAAVKDYFVENGHHYLVLEYMDGKDLRHFVREKGPQKEALVLRWALEIAEILEYLHGLNPPIVHRDLTPDNLVLEANGSIALIDFGAANEFLGAATGTLIGKQSYISPEQFRGKACPSSDLYSLGATLHYLLTGQDPDGLSESHPRELMNSISAEMDALIAELTAIDLDRRISSASVLKERCRAVLDANKGKRSSVVSGVAGAKNVTR